MVILIKAKLLEVGDIVTYGWINGLLYEVVLITGTAAYIQRLGGTQRITVHRSDTVYLKVTSV